MAEQISKLIARLPQPLRERARLVQAAPMLPAAARAGVLYWMRAAIRSDENPALQTALWLAEKLKTGLLVYQGLTERYPYASDRHHRFILEGARDVQADLERWGISYAFHLERPTHRGAHLKKLVEQAALVVTEDMPVQPLVGWTQSIASQSTAPVVAVDTACVVPMQLVGRGYERAFAFRKATQQLYDQRVTRQPMTVNTPVNATHDFKLSFEPLDLQQADLAQLVSTCEIDHAIGPVPHTPGGSIAGYQRWENFKQRGLASYAKRRNNALVDGVSRLSPYLHYGMVSPMRIAREAALLRHEGAAKFLDELLIWRELAYVFCFFRSDHDQLSALPEWAVATLAEHESDPRPQLFSWETLARGRTGDALWDAAQKSLLIHGELHNNVRMTWGKMLLNWTTNAQTALKMIIDLNHRYALDGRDPASYGGILWCLGQFDRPFPPPQAIFGTVRGRSTRQHAKRLDPQAYLGKTTRALNHPMPSVAIIGAGMAGLACARTLADHGFPVSVFEKSRGVAGRMATRRAGNGLQFDHGAQYFTVSDQRFGRYVQSWKEDGFVAVWEGRVRVLENGMVRSTNEEKDRYVGVPGMNAVGKHLATDLKVHKQTRVAAVTRDDAAWQLANENGQHLGAYDCIVISAPAAQTTDLLQEAAPDLAQQAGQVDLQPCWAVMMEVPQPLVCEFDGAFVYNSPLAWVARNSSKPGRPRSPETWVLHGSADWSRKHLELSADQVAGLLIESFWQAAGLTACTLGHIAAHRWRYAQPAKPLQSSCLSNDAGLVVCGDWCCGAKVEPAFLSGMAAAGRIMGTLGDDASSPHFAVQQPTLF